ncbi:MAG: hypothetical protein JWP61_215 [Friedmanniella sp.]|nr:hypothetical protein [Friedmanniella sp.]
MAADPESEIGLTAGFHLPSSREHGVALDTVPDENGRSSFWHDVLGEIRWSLTAPWLWFSGVAFNLALAVAWLFYEPLQGRPHSDWAIIVGTYFAVWILADVTTTNVLGADAARVRLSVLRGVPMLRILMVKNLTLLILVGLPTLIATAVITVRSEADYRLVITLPGVAFPVLTWVGVGNVASVLMPVLIVPLKERWRRRRQLWPTVRWLGHLCLPYALLAVVQPAGALPRLITRHLTFVSPTLEVKAVVVTLTGLFFWGAGTAAALGITRHRGITIR